MKKVSILAVLFLVFCVAQVWATPLACASGVSLTTYLGTGFSCTIGDKTFSNFNYTDSAQGGALAVTSDGVTVTTMGPVGSGATLFSADIGLQFNGGWNALAGQIVDSDISFVVSVTGGGPQMIKDAGLAQVSSVVANGSASVSEDACTPGIVAGVVCNPAAGTITVLTFDSGGTSIMRSNNTLFAPTGSISVSKDISVTGGTTGQAHLSIVQDTFSQTSVPEPATMLLVGTTLLGVGLIRRRATKA